MGGEVYVVLFRGVGGHTKLPTEPLREALTKAGFNDVVTYIATGNVVLASKLRAAAVQKRVAAIAKQDLGFLKKVIVMTRAEWAALIAGNPFPQGVGAPRSLHAFVLEAEPAKAAVKALSARAAGSERVKVRGRVLYFYAPDGFGTSKLPPLVDRVLTVATTARNWNTVVKLGTLADQIAARRRSGA
jgi:uncharacterized protein (DUF1697 family)